MSISNEYLNFKVWEVGIMAVGQASTKMELLKGEQPEWIGGG
jgi:hypothetical protein